MARTRTEIRREITEKEETLIYNQEQFSKIPDTTLNPLTAYSIKAISGGEVELSITFVEPVAELDNAIEQVLRFKGNSLMVVTPSTLKAAGQQLIEEDQATVDELYTELKAVL